MKRVILICVLIIVFACSTLLCSNMILNGDVVLKNFDITSVKNDYSNYTIEYEKVPAAINYKITILDNNNVKIFEKETKKNKETINLSNLNYGIEYSLMVYAYNSIGESRPANKPYNFTYLVPSINKNNSLILNNKDYYLSIDGELSKKEYTIKIVKDDKEVIKESLKDNSFKIDKSLYANESTKLNVSIMYKDKIIDSINLFNNMNPLGNVNIISPKNEELVSYNDITLSFNGGLNANEFIVKVYNNKGKVMKTTSTKKNSVVLSKNLFTKGSSYTLEVIAKYGDFSKNTMIKVNLMDKDQVNAVYISNNYKNIKKGTKLFLGCDTEESKIYYTLNGDDPNTNGILYTEPIVINENTVLKTVASKEDYYNSIVKEYNINVSDKKELKVFISPSNQVFNLGVSKVGFTNERDEMNDVANYVVERLEQYNVKVYRNNPATNINAWLKDSNYYGVDVHVAIHSNASVKHNTYGVETWVDNESSESFGLAHLMQDRMYEIYPYKDKVGANRGVKYANGALGEVNNNYLSNGLLIEIAHHDYEMDAKWIMENKKDIGYNIADSILKYYQIIE